MITPEGKILLKTKIQELLQEPVAQNIPADALPLYLSGKLNESKTIQVSKQKTIVQAKPVNIPKLLMEGVITPQEVGGIVNHPACTGLVGELINENIDDISLSATFLKLLRMASVCGLIPPGKEESIIKRFNPQVLQEEDKLLPPEQQRFELKVTNTITEEIQKSWAEIHVKKLINGDEIVEILEEING